MRRANAYSLSASFPSDLFWGFDKGINTEMLNCSHNGKIFCSLDLIDAKGSYIKEKKMYLRKLSNTNCLHCPECKSIVKLRAGTVKIPHFYHFTEANSCTYNSSLGESALHRQAKFVLRKAFLDWHPTAKVEVEYYIGKRRADLYIELRNHKLVVEYQNSPISITEWESREIDFRSSHLSSLWIFGNNLKFNPEKSSLWKAKRQSVILQFSPGRKEFFVTRTYRDELIEQTVKLADCFISLSGDFEYNWKQKKQEIDKAIERRIKLGRNSYKGFRDMKAQKDSKALSILKQSESLQYQCKFCGVLCYAKDLIAINPSLNRGTCRKCYMTGKTKGQNLM